MMHASEVLVLFWFSLACTPKAPPAPMTEASAPLVAPAPVSEGGPWVTSVYVDHPLVGRIWSIERGAFVDSAALLSDLRSVPFVLLGEKHDNADHHRLQAVIIADLKPSAVAYEMLDHEDPVADAKDPDSLATASRWAESGWPDFDLYKPVFSATYASGAKVIAAHPTRDEVKGAMMEGIASLPAEATAGLALDKILSEASRASLSEEIIQSHCGHASAQVVEMMIGGQILKDAWMARALTGASTGVLIAGAGHARKDRGVPHYLDKGSKTVLFVEVQSGEETASVYEESADYLWFTPRVDDIDPCEKFREQLEQMGPATPAP